MGTGVIVMTIINIVRNAEAKIKLMVILLRQYEGCTQIEEKAIPVRSPRRQTKGNETHYFINDCFVGMVSDGDIYRPDKNAPAVMEKININ